MKADKFASFTGSHINQVLAIVLDKQVISAPTIQTPLPRAPVSLPATSRRKRPIAWRSSCATVRCRSRSRWSKARPSVRPLGQDSLDKSLQAGVIGLVLVIAFMVLYYRLPGVIASVALLIYAVLTFSLFKLIPVTLTLPGVAGFILSTGDGGRRQRADLRTHAGGAARRP